MNITVRPFSIMLLSVSIAALSACGGGGGSSSAASTSTGGNPATGGTPEPQGDLVPAATSASFEAFVKHGLSQWAGTSESPLATQLSAQPAIDLDGVIALAAESSALNVQVQGVDEANLTRFNGNHIFTADLDKINIIKTNNAVDADNKPSSTLVATLTLPENTDVQGLYLLEDAQQDDLLIALGSEYYYRWQEDVETPWPWQGGSTLLEFYNVADPANAKRINNLTIEGYLIDSRRINDTLYVVSRATPSIAGLVDYPKTDEARAANEALIEAADLNDLLPKVIYADNSVNELVAATNCFAPKVDNDDLHFPSLVTISAINLRDPTDIKSICMVENAYGIYVSANAMYLTSLDYSNSSPTSAVSIISSTKTKIHKFAFTSNGPAYKGSGEVSGFFSGFDPAYHMGEYKNQLAIVTSDAFNAGHKITLLEEAADLKLKQVAQLPNTNRPASIGKEGEQIYAVRIIGSRAYIVTFQTTDPLYVIDLDDLQILGELEIPGFSSYLHPVSENLVLGIGKSSVTHEGFPYFQGIKLSLFDVSDPANPVRAAEHTIGLRGTDSPVSYDPHALAYISEYSAGIDRLAIPVRVHGEGIDVPAGTPPWTHYSYSHTGLYLFELDKGEKTLAAKGDLRHLDDSSCYIGNDRGFIAGDAVHFMLNGDVYSAPWNNPSQLETLDLDVPAKPCFIEFPIIAI